MKPAQIKKALVAAATGVTELIALGVLHDSVIPWAVAALAALGTYGVYAVKNEA